jgi:Gas vesicle protein
MIVVPKAMPILVRFLYFLERNYSLTLKLFAMNTKSKVLLGILGAAAAGVVIGMLIAPEKGNETRKRLRKTAGDWADSLSHMWEKGRRAAEESAQDVKDKARYAKSAAEEKVSKMKESFS